MSLLESKILAQPVTKAHIVQLKKAAMCRDLEKLFGGDYKKWLKAVKHVKATPSYARLSKITKLALDNLEAELEEKAEES